MSQPRMESVKLMTVGDGAVGKTSLLMSYALDKFPEDYVPTVFDNYTCTMVYNKNIHVSLGLWDTAGQDDYEQMRPLAFPGTHVFLICFSLISRSSFENVESHWIKEIKTFSKDVPFVLCGTKLDCVSEPEILKKLEDNGEKPVTKEEGESLAKKLGAYAFCMCSGKTQQGITEVVKKASEAGLLYQGILQKSDLEGNSSNTTNKNATSTQNQNTGSRGDKNEGCCILM
nr:unnamed protein product [Naegleria fowleri]